MRNWLLRKDIQFGDDGEPNAAGVAALQGLINDRAGGRVVRLVHQPRPTSLEVRTEPEDEDDFYYPPFWGPAQGLQQAGDNWYPKVTEPQPAGVKLLMSGDFGNARNRLGTPRNSNIYYRLGKMALQPRAVNPADLKHNLIPNTHGTTVAAYYSNIYVAQFSPGTSYGEALI
jgi:WD repeat-containing protein 23